MSSVTTKQDLTIGETDGQTIRKTDRQTQDKVIPVFLCAAVFRWRNSRIGTQLLSIGMLETCLKTVSPNTGKRLHIKNIEGIDDIVLRKPPVLIRRLLHGKKNHKKIFLYPIFHFASG